MKDITKRDNVSELNPFGFTLEKVDIELIEPHPLNPRKISSRDKMQLKRNITKFGLIDKPILNLQESEEYPYRCLAGHQRLSLMHEAEGVSVIECWVPDFALPQADAEEFLVRHNKNAGEFDLEKLSNFDPDDLVDFGFLHSELPAGPPLEGDEEETDPVFPITPKFSENHSYVLITVTNDIDKANLETLLGLEKVQDYKTSRVGVGRVITFDKFKKKWDERKG